MVVVADLLQRGAVTDRNGGGNGPNRQNAALEVSFSLKVTFCMRLTASLSFTFEAYMV
jgi:hypothetical protein